MSETYNLLLRSAVIASNNILDHHYIVPNEHETLSQCWLKVGPDQKAVAQQWSNSGSMPRVCWVIWGRIGGENIFIHLDQTLVAPESWTTVPVCSHDANSRLV